MEIIVLRAQILKKKKVKSQKHMGSISLRERFQNDHAS